MSRVAASLLALGLALVVGLAALTKEQAVVATVVVLAQILIAYAPSPVGADGEPIPAPKVLATLAGGFVAVALACQPVFLIGADGTRAGIDGISITGVLAGLVPATAIGVLVAIVAQMERTDDRRALVPSLSFVVSLVLFAGLASAWVGVARTGLGREVVVICSAALVGALAVWMAFGPHFLPSVAAVAVGAASAAAMSLRLSGATTWSFAAIIGAGVSGFAIVGLLVGLAWSADRPDLPTRWGFAGAFAFAFVGPLVYVAGQMVNAAP